VDLESCKEGHADDLDPRPSPVSTPAPAPSRHLEVHLGDPGAALVISFGFASWDAPPGFDFTGRIAKLGSALGTSFHRLALRDPDNLWYQAGLPDVAGGAVGLHALLAGWIDRLRPVRVITIGQSMGAYAAIHYGRALGVDGIVAFGPQSWLLADEARRLGDTRWLPVMSRLREPTGNGICLDLLAARPETDRVPEIRIVYGLRHDDSTGPPNFDAWHAARLAVLPRTTLHPIADAPHAVVGWLKDHDLLDDLLRRLAAPLLEAEPVAAAPPPALRPIRVEPAPLPAGWRQWVAENRLRGCTPESMVDGMAAHGVSREAALRETRTIVDDPVYLAAQKFLSLKTKLESVLESHQALWEAAPDYERVERRSHIGKDEFFRRYYLGARPVVVSGLARDWPAMERWQPHSLAERFGELEVEIQAGRDDDPDYEVNSVALRRRVRFADFLGRIVAGGPSNDLYLTANNHVFRDPAFASLHAEVGKLPDYLTAEDIGRHGSWWVGPAGAITPLHHDMLMLFHVQIVGRKRWRLISPLQIARVYNHQGVFSPVDLDAVDYERYPLMRGVRVLEVVVEPGDAIFLPLAWWHQVTSLDPTVSLSISNLAFPNSFTYVNPEIRNW